ncbi:hypothetical protein BROUX41_001628 [Berkeleyomyces rouxiae]|uniref:uncharacterized protein n=1 Tax=Berkeleyomyces rouxiae TaxID=2035830 RepID=UPI003B828B3B
MSKRTTFTNITPVPAGMGREIVLAFLHSHEAMLYLSPLVVSHKAIRAPANCPPDERSCSWYQIRGKGWHLPGSNKMTGDSSYTIALESTPVGCTAHSYAPLNIDIRSAWMLGGRLPGEGDRRTDGYSAPENAPPSGLYVREDVEIRCPTLMSGYIKKMIKKSQNALTEKLQQRARRHSSKPFLGASTNGPVDMPQFSTEPSPVHYNYKMEMYQPLLAFDQELREQLKDPQYRKLEARSQPHSRMPSPARTPVRTFTNETMDSYTSSVISPVSDGTRDSMIISALSPPPIRTPRVEGSQFPQLDVHLDTATPVIPSAVSSNGSAHYRSISAPSLNQSYAQPSSFSASKAAKSNSHVPTPLDLQAEQLEEAQPEQKQTPLFSNNLYLPPTSRQRSHSHGNNHPAVPMTADTRRPSRPVSTPFLSSNQPWVADDPLDFFVVDGDEERARSARPYLSPLIIPRNSKSPAPLLVGKTQPKPVAPAPRPEPHFMAGLRMQQQLAQSKPQGSGHVERSLPIRTVQKVPAMDPAPPTRHARGLSREVAVHGRKPSAGRQEYTLPRNQLTPEPSASSQLQPAHPPPPTRPAGLQREFSFNTTPDDVVAPKSGERLRLPESPDSTTPTLRNSLSTTASSVLPEQEPPVGAARGAIRPGRPLEQQLRQYAVAHQLPFHSPSDPEDPETELSPGAMAAIQAVREMEIKNQQQGLHYRGGGGAKNALAYPAPLRIEKWVASISQAAPPPPPPSGGRLKPAVSVVHKYPNAHKQDYTDLATANPFADD